MYLFERQNLFSLILFVLIKLDRLKKLESRPFQFTPRDHLRSPMGIIWFEDHLWLI